jgi:hypothetical protein
MDDALLKKLRDDLEKSGFGAEMQALKMMVERGWHYVGSDAYLDEDADTFREMDASGFLQRLSILDGKILSMVFIFLAIEVKKATTPWVIFKPPTPSSSDYREAIGPLVYGANLPCPVFRLQEAFSCGSIAERNGWLGRGLHEAFKNPSDKSRWYSAFVTSCKAAEYIMRREVRAEDPRGSISDDLRKKPTYLLLSRPVVVLDGTLLAAELDDAGELLLSATEAATFEFRFASKHCKENRYNVDLVTLSGFAAYLDSWIERRNRIAAAVHKTAGFDEVSYED